MTATGKLETARTACVVFLGCPKNQVDSEYVLGSLTEAGYRLTTAPRSADLVVITTCAFLQSAVRESEAAINEALKLKQGSSGRKVVVAGCLVERYGDSLKKRFPSIDLLVPLADLNRIPQLLSPPFSLPYVTSNHKPQAKHDVALSKRSASKGLSEETPRLRSGRHSRLSSAICNRPEPPSHAPRTSPRVLSTPRHFAYLKIADGCDNRCSYCMIPEIRGPFRSRPLNDIVAEARALARAGVRELILVAQDTTLYGTDIYGRPSLARLLRELEHIDAIRWLRLMYTHPAHITEDVIDQFSSNRKLCRYIDLPIQHVADHLLEKMNRRYTGQDIELLLESLRAVPDMHIRTTIIVGLPGETSRDFEELLAFVRSAKFDRLSCYAYSPEPGTRAACLSAQVSPAVKKERVRRLMLAQAAISRTNLVKLVGRKLTVLVDTVAAENGDCTAPRPTQALGGTVPDFPRSVNRQGRQGSEGICHLDTKAPITAIARSEWDAPEIDGVVKLSGRKVAPGTFVQALVTGSSAHDLAARVL